MAKVMIVDDAADASEALGRYLEKSGHLVRCVPDGREALAQVILDVPDVVVLDLLMPEMDGPSFLEIVRSYLRLRSLPVVVLTALGESPMVDRARASGVSSVLVKGRAAFPDVKRAVEEAICRAP
jgi:CheY-like chemotaxis protein